MEILLSFMTPLTDLLKKYDLLSYGYIDLHLPSQLWLVLTSTHTYMYPFSLKFLLHIAWPTTISYAHLIDRIIWVSPLKPTNLPMIGFLEGILYHFAIIILLSKQDVKVSPFSYNKYHLNDDWTPRAIQYTCWCFCW